MKTCHDLSYAGYPYIVTDITAGLLFYSSLDLAALLLRIRAYPPHQ
jgi:hypothetical protein